MYKCLISTDWYTFTFIAGETYDIDDMLAPRLIRSGKFIKVKDSPIEVHDDLAVGQPEADKAFKPVATVIEPLPNDDLAIPGKKGFIPKEKKVHKPKRK